MRVMVKVRRHKLTRVSLTTTGENKALNHAINLRLDRFCNPSIGDAPKRGKSEDPRPASAPCRKAEVPGASMRIIDDESIGRHKKAGLVVRLTVITQTLVYGYACRP